MSLTSAEMVSSFVEYGNAGYVQEICGYLNMNAILIVLTSGFTYRIISTVCNVYILEGGQVYLDGWFCHRYMNIYYNCCDLHALNITCID